jgi:hypothetical protein
MLTHAEGLPAPQRAGLRTAFGLDDGAPPDLFLVGLAVLGLLSNTARHRPLVCIVDDAQWLDQASAQALGVAARRLAADPVGLVFATRNPGGSLDRLPDLLVAGLGDDDARALLESALPGPLDGRVRDLIVAETRGNPLALLELPRGLTSAELAGGFGLPGGMPLTRQIEDSFASSCCNWLPPIRRVTRSWCGGRRAYWASAPRWRDLRWTWGWSSSAVRSGFGIPWFAPRPIGRPRSPRGGGCTRRWRR